jgi:hypothetical protein
MSERSGPPRRHEREAQFDEALRVAARSLVTDELPRGVLDEPVSAGLGLGRAVDGAVAARRAVPGFAAAFAAAIVLVLAAAVAFGPRLPGGPGPSPSPSPAPSAIGAFRTSADIRGDLAKLSYTCQAGQSVAPSGSGPDVVTRESVVCLPPTDGKPYMAAVIVGESAAGRVVEVHAKADLVGGDVAASRIAVATLLGKAAAVVVHQGSGTPVGSWVESNLPALAANDSVSTTIAGVHLEMARSATGGYTLRLTPVATAG